MPIYSTSFLLIFNYFDLIELQIDRSLSAEHRDYNADSVLIGLKLVHDAAEAGQRPVGDTYGIAELIVQNDLLVFDTQIINFLLRQGDGLTVGAYEACCTADVMDKIQLSSVRIIFTRT